MAREAKRGTVEERGKRNGSCVSRVTREYHGAFSRSFHYECKTIASREADVQDLPQRPRLHRVEIASAEAPC